MAIALVSCSGDNDPTPEVFTVTFSANGGTPEPQAITVEKGSKINEPSITKENNTLDGWYKESTFSTKWNFSIDTVITDITLYAKWNQLCNCNPKDHLGIDENCDCEKSNCDCTLKIYGTLSNNTPIYRNGNILDSEMSTSVIAACDGWDSCLSIHASLEGKIDEIHIVPSTSLSPFEYKLIDTKKCLLAKIGFPAVAFAAAFNNVDTGTLTLTQ